MVCLFAKIHHSDSDLREAAPAERHTPESLSASATSTKVSDSGKYLLLISSKIIRRSKDIGKSVLSRFIKTPQAIEARGMHRVCSLFVFPPYCSSALHPSSDVALLAWHGFKQLSKNTEKFLEGTPFKIPVGVINTVLATADVSSILYCLYVFLMCL